VTERLRDEQLAWLAVRDSLQRHDRGRISSRIGAFLDRRSLRAARERITGPSAGRSGGAGLGDVDVAPSSPYMVRSSLAVEEVSRRLSDSERATLRATGEVPEWFLPEVTSVARHII
jgi:hypothetical protein